MTFFRTFLQVMFMGLAALKVHVMNVQTSLHGPATTHIAAAHMVIAALLDKSVAVVTSDLGNFNQAKCMF